VSWHKLRQRWTPQRAASQAHRTWQPPSGTRCETTTLTRRPASASRSALWPKRTWLSTPTSVICPQDTARGRRNPRGDILRQAADAHYAPPARRTAASRGLSTAGTSSDRELGCCPHSKKWLATGAGTGRTDHPTGRAYRGRRRTRCLRTPVRTTWPAAASAAAPGPRADTATRRRAVLPRDSQAGNGHLPQGKPGIGQNGPVAATQAISTTTTRPSRQPCHDDAHDDTGRSRSLGPARNAVRTSPPAYPEDHPG
jgi:hypothetical protein